MGLASLPGEEAIAALLSLAEKVLDYQTVKIIRENFTKSRDLRLKILDEWKKGDQADLAKIGHLEDQIGIYEKAIVDEIQLARSQKGLT